MINQILLWLDNSPAARAAASWTIAFARSTSARIYALYVLPATAKSRREKRNSVQEEQAWQVLYEVEDEAFDQQVRISLLLETGDPLSRLTEVCTSYQPDIIVVSADTLLSAESLIRHLPKPVIFYKLDKED